jgi:hypothetical protein
MTTIAWDGRYLAADTRETWDKSIPTFSRKLEILTPDIVIAYAGSSYVYKEVTEFLLGKRDKLGKDAKIVEALLLLQGQPYNWAGTAIEGMVKIHTPPHAIGSGWKYAWAYLKDGYDAMQAIKKSSAMDIWTNDVVDYYDTKTKKLYLAKFPETTTKRAP